MRLIFKIFFVLLILAIFSLKIMHASETEREKSLSGQKTEINSKSSIPVSKSEIQSYLNVQKMSVTSFGMHDNSVSMLY